MIRALRNRHRWMIAILAVAAIALLIAALASRPEAAVQERFPEPVAREGDGQ